jgi:hypothetical protein
MNRTLMVLNALVVAMGLYLLIVLVPLMQHTYAVLAGQLVWFAPAIVTWQALAKNSRTLGGFAMLGNAWWVASGTVGVLMAVLGGAGSESAFDAIVVLLMSLIVLTAGVLNLKLVWVAFPKPSKSAQLRSKDQSDI